MSASTGGPWTRHGHDIPGVTVAGGMPPAIARCGGPALCRQCRDDVEQARGEKPAAPDPERQTTVAESGGCGVSAAERVEAAELADAERWVRRRASTTNGTAEGKRSIGRVLREYDWRAEAINAMAAELERLEAQRDAVLALATEWEKEASADYSRRNLTGNEIWETVGEQSTCRAHAAELREALGIEP